MPQLQIALAPDGQSFLDEPMLREEDWCHTDLKGTLLVLKVRRPL